MRLAFLISALALSLGLGWFFLVTEPPPSLASDVTIAVQESPPPSLSDAPPGVAIPGAAPLDFDAPEAERSVALSAPQRPAIRWNELEILGRLVSTEGSALANYSVLVAPSGLKPAAAGRLPLGQLSVTDAHGNCEFRGLSKPGPWDVYAFPMDLDVEQRTLERSARVGTVTARNPGDAERVTFSVATGPVVVLRAPLPDGVTAEELWFEALPTAAQGARTGQAHRYAQGALSEDGYVTALLPLHRTPPQNRGFGVRVRTFDGLYGLVAIRSDGLAQQLKIVIDEPLERRGRVTVRLVIRDLRSGSGDEVMDDDDWLRAIEAVDWQLLMEDGARTGEGLPDGFRTASEHRAWARTGTDTFELTDLPLGVPVEIGALGKSALGTEAFVPEALLRTTSVHGLVHGDAEALELRVRRIRE